MNSQITRKDDAVTLLQPLLTGQLSKNSLRAYKQDIEGFFGIPDLTLLTREMIQSVTIQTVIDWRNRLLSQYKSATVARKLSTIRTVFSYFVDAGLIQNNPAKNSWVKSPKVPTESLTECLTRSEAELLLKQPNKQKIVGIRDYAILLLGLHNGLRRAEICDLKIESLKMDGLYYVLHVYGKGSKLRIAKLKPQVWEAIQDYLKARSQSALNGGDYLFKNHSTGKVIWQKQTERLTGEAIRRMIQKYAKRAGIQKRIVPHGLRRSFTTFAIENGAKLHQVQIALGHEDPRTTMRYFKHRDNLVENATDYVHI